MKNTKTGLRNNYGIHDSYFWPFLDTIYKEAFVEDNGYEPNNQELINFADDCVTTDFEELLESIRFYQNKHSVETYVVLARLGLWDGLHDGGKIIVGMTHVISQCIEDLDHFKIKFINGQLQISGFHHDGANHFYIRQLTEKGKEYIDNHPFLDDRTLHGRLFRSSKYSKRVEIFDKMWFLPES